MNDVRKKGEGWIGVDFDGTLAHYTGFQGEDHVGAPIEPMVRKTRKWLREGKDVRLFTARKPNPVLRRWMLEHLGEVLPICREKDHECQAIYDDRAVQVKRNTGHVSPDDEAQVWEKS